MQTKKQKIIAIEGVDGSGKTTIIHKICDCVQKDVLVYSRTKKGKRLDQFLASKVMNYIPLAQIPIYLFLSYKNFKSLRNLSNYEKIIMERCFLSNICYFYPKAMHNKWLLKLALSVEVKLIPEKIFVIDVDPTVGQKRDQYKKNLAWLVKTRKNYLDSARAELLRPFHIQVIDKSLDIESTIEQILSFITCVNDEG